MTRFTEETVQCLKETMRKRMPACYYQPEDVQDIMTSTGLSESQIQHWAWNIRNRFPENQQKEQFLTQSIEVRFFVVLKIF